ncbi:MAG TPA: formate dehydrogenase, partial [Candidatus Atribacteria bacterium]|nr:formate dehydrogenase [Candidatus Atribacteria bacterium]
MKEVKVVCPRDCYDTCFLLALVDGDKIVSMRGSFDNPITQGFICPRGVKDHERVYSKNRVLNPHIRIGEKPGRKFEKTSWNEALNIIAKKIREVIRDHGAQSILHLEYSGNSGLITQSFSQRIWYAIGATRTDYSLCSRSGHTAISLHYGLTYGIRPEELLNMKLIVFWGFNARVSSPHLWALALRARRRKATIAVIDPRESESARDANIWIKPKPG